MELRCTAGAAAQPLHLEVGLWLLGLLLNRGSEGGDCLGRCWTAFGACRRVSEWRHLTGANEVLLRGSASSQRSLLGARVLLELQHQLLLARSQRLEFADLQIRSAAIRCYYAVIAYEHTHTHGWLATLWLWSMC